MLALVQNERNSNSIRKGKGKGKGKSKAFIVQAQRVPGRWDSQILRQSAQEDGKFVSLTHRQPLPPGNISGIRFCYRLSRPHGYSAAGRIVNGKFDDAITNQTCYIRQHQQNAQYYNIIIIIIIIINLLTYCNWVFARW
jgi:hypothetical protein